MKNRTELAKHFAKLGFKKGAEIGVFEGYYSKVLLDTIPDLTLYMIDSWILEERRRKAYEKVIKSFTNPRAIIIKGNSVEVAKTIEQDSLDFVFIDAAHDYKSVKEDLEAWVPKVRKGGIVSGHDYYNGPSGRMGVIKAVDEFVKNNGLTLELTEWDKEAPHKDDRQPCWYFTK